MSINNVAHVASVDKGLKMKIKRTKGPNKVDSKHEVVKPDSRSAILSLGQPVSTLSAAVFTSVSNPSFNVVSAIATSRMSGNLTSQTLAASVTAALALPSSTSLTLSLPAMPSTSPTSLLSSASSGMLVSSHVTNPTVALLKSVGAGMITSDAPCGNTSRGKSPSKTGSPGPDAKEGKSPKTKAAYNKKVKDIKGKIEVVGSALSPLGNSQPVLDARTCAGIVTSVQTLFCSPQPPTFTSLPAVGSSPMTSEPCPGDIVHVKKENIIHDPYEFNAKVEDKIELPPKKLKLEKADCMETSISPQPQLHPLSPAMPHPCLIAPSLQHQQPDKRSVGVDALSVGVITEPDCLGPCEPGTLVGLEGIVWKETDNGLLVVNVTWRGKTYVGTLMDATRYAWAPPRPNGCESPVSDFESRTPKGRGKRNCRNSAQSSERLPEGRSLRKGRRGTVNSSSSFTAPPSPAKSDLCSNSLKRKNKPSEASNDKAKRSRSCSRGVTCAESPPPDDYIVCPEPNCHKKYKHMNGLRYHRTHAHQKPMLTGDNKDDEVDDEEEEEDDKQEKKEKTTLSERAERMKAKERQRMKEKHRVSDRDSRDSLDDDIPLKEIANKGTVQISVQLPNIVSDIKDKPVDESSSNNTDAGTSSLTETIKTEAEDALTHTDNTNQEIEFSSLGTNSIPVSCTDSVPASKTGELVSMAGSSCASFVPSVPSTSESSLSVTESSGNININLPFVTSMKSQAYQVSPPVTIGGVTQTSQIATVNVVTHIPQTIAANSGGTHVVQTSTTSSELTHIPQSTTTSGFSQISQSTAQSGFSQNSQSTVHSGFSQISQSTTNSGFSQTPQSTINSGFSQILQSTTNSGFSQIPQNTTHSGFLHTPHSTTNCAVTIPTINCTISQTNAVAPPPVLAMALQPDRQSGGKCPTFLKAITAVRPIVPAPSSQLSGTNNLHSQTFNSQTTAQPHGSTLKPIQPRPTIMGDYPVVSPVLSDLNKDKLKRHKKKKEKGSPVISPVVQLKTGSKGQMSSRECSDTSSAVISRCDMHKNERTAVITSSNPSKSFDAPSNILKTQFHSTLDSSNLPCTTSNDTPHSGVSRLAVPPSTLSISPFTADKHNNVSDDVHSPAYSDISDANDSNSPIQQDSPRKDSSLKKDDPINGPSHLTTDGNSHSQHYGNMFYYGGPSNYLSHGINSQGASPALSKGQIKSDDVEENKPCGASENLQDRKDGSRSVQELELQQKSLINYYAHLHGVSPATVQFQFNPAGYNSPSLDPSYAMISQQALVAEQKRLIQQDHTNMSEDCTGQRAPSGLLSTNRPNGSGYDFSGKSKMGAGMTEGQDIKRNNDERDQAQRHKHNDGRQNTPEHIDMKSQMGFHQQIEHLSQEQQNQHSYQSMKHHNYMLNAHVYQQQRNKVYDNQRQDKRSAGAQTNSRHTSSNKSRHFADNSPQEIISPDAIKKEVVHPRDSSRLDSKLDTVDSKRVDIKDENPQSKLASSTQELSSRSRPASQSGTPNIPAVNTSCTSLSSLPSSITTSLPVSLVASLPPTGAAFPYTPYYPHFRPVPLDPMYRAISPHIIGYASTAPGYIHHAQLGFRMPPVDAERKSTDTAESHRGDVAGMVGKTTYTPVHKIHELHEKGRPSPGVSSPAITKQPCGDNVNSQGSTTPGPVPEKVKDKQREYSSSPPTQRHVHTHHHTHVVGGFPPLYPPDAYSAMFGHPATAAATIQTAPHSFPPAHPPPAPKS